MKFRIAALTLILACSAGCSSMGVEPWERDVLAREDMALIVDPLEAATDDHIYFSKEATSGGCGCN